MSFISLIRTKEQAADAIAAFLPNDRLWYAKWRAGKKLRRLLLGLGIETLRANGYLNEALADRDPRTTSNFLEEWEAALGLPLSCKNIGEQTLEVRRAAVIGFLQERIQTVEDFNRIVQLFGVDGFVSPYGDVTGFPLTFPFSLVGPNIQSRFTMALTINRAAPPVGEVFPYELPIVLGSSEVPMAERALICFIQQTKPANVYLFVRYV